MIVDIRKFRTENVQQRLRDMTSGFGPDVVIEAVGSTPTYLMAVDAVAFTGRVVCIGYAKTEISFETKYFVQKELDIRGSRNAMPQDFRAVIHCAALVLLTVSLHVSSVLRRPSTPCAGGARTQVRCSVSWWRLMLNKRVR